MSTFQLLDACIKNCGTKFHLEIASRDFETEFQRLMGKAPTAIAQKMRVSLKKWAENEFKSDSQLNLIPSLYQKLKSEGYDFSDTASSTPKVQQPISKDPNVVSSQQEEDDIAKAIELSLKEKGEGAKAQTATSYVSCDKKILLLSYIPFESNIYYVFNSCLFAAVVVSKHEYEW